MQILKLAWEQNTWKTYNSACKSYSRFCLSHGVSQCFPPTGALLIAWMISLRFIHNLAASTSATYLTGLKGICKIGGIDVSCFDDFQLHYVMRGLRKSCPFKRAASPRLPITIWMLARFILGIGQSYDEKLFAAVFAVGIYGLLRAGEFVSKSGKVSLCRADATWFPNRVELCIQSKTDVFKTGTTVILWKDGSICCPWTLLKFIFDHEPDKHPFAPLLQNADGSPFSYSQLTRAVVLLAQVCGLDPSCFKTHSMRMGGATSLAILGFPSHVIQRAGRWKSLAYQLYPHPSRSQMQQVAQALGDAASSAQANSKLFGGIAFEKMAYLEWDDFADVTLFQGHAGGCQSVRWSFS